MTGSRLTYVELFAGAGGLSLGLEAAGFHPIAHCEIEPNARAVLRYRWPAVRLDGDVTQVNGADFKGVTLISGGSPCQDLSVAGKRKGLAGERSGLFHQQVRIWQESEAPYLIWENVLGALSSNNGRDFGTVLSTLVGATLPVPSDGWRGGGVAAGPDAVAAWRVLDLQHFGPPQRRVRVFVVAARTGGVDPAEVLALSEGVCGHPSPREQSRQRAARGTRTGTESGICVADFNSYERTVEEVVCGVRVNSSAEAGVLTFAASSIGGYKEGVGSLRATGGDAHGGSETLVIEPKIMAFESTGGSWGVNEGDTAPPIKIGTGLEIASPPAIIALNGTDTVGSLLARGDSSPCVDRGQPAVVAFEPRYYTRDNKTGGAPSDLVKVDASIGKNGDAVPHVVCTTGDVTHALTHEGADASEDGTGRGTPVVVGTLTVGGRDKGAGDSYDNKSITVQHRPEGLPAIGRPRRLTPLECERLMSWPDAWTATGVKEDGTQYALSDTARYRLCGNGVGSVCVAWFAHRLVDAIQASTTTQP